VTTLMAITRVSQPDNARLSWHTMKTREYLP
jgi:hypothetical protein